MIERDLDRITDAVLSYNPDTNADALQAIAGATDKPLVIESTRGVIEIPCYVLEDETRVLTQRGVFSAVGAARGGPRNAGEAKMLGGAEPPRFASQRWLRPYISRDLLRTLKAPIPFRLPTGVAAYGYPATILADICDAIIEAQSDGMTTERQSSIVERALILVRGFARVGIIALVDEATGYQRIREERALAHILEKFIAKELQPWTKTFPFEFYEQICRLREWPSFHAVKRPSVIGKYTNDFVYERLAPGILDELRRKNPVTPEGYRRYRHHQWFTPDLGHPKLQQHLAGVLAIMKVSSSWNDFRRKISVAYPKLGETIPLNFELVDDMRN